MATGKRGIREPKTTWKDSCDVRTLRTRSALEELATDWSTLPQAREDPLRSHRWNAVAAATLHSDGSLHVITVRHDGRLVAVAPMAERRRHGVRRLEFIGASVLHESSGLLAEDPAALARLCEALVNEQLPFVLDRVSDESGLRRLLRASCHGRGLLFIAGNTPSLRVDFTGNWEDFLASRPVPVRSEYRRKRRQLEATGRVVFDARRPAPAELSAVMQEAFDIETNSRQSAQMRLFIGELAVRFAATSDLRVGFLRAGDQAVATNILLEFDRCLWEIGNGCRGTTRRDTVGLLLLTETLREAADRGLRGYEFLGSDLEQHSAWATGERRLQTLAYYPYTLGGAWTCIADAVASLLRRPHAAIERT